MGDTAGGKIYIRRFSPYRLVEHWLAALSFAIQLITGFSQKFYSLELSQWVVLSLGGIDTTRFIHRLTGLFLVLLVAEHLTVAFFGVLSGRWQPSILIAKDDFRDAMDNLKYYFGLAVRPARCDRFDYKQKFEYWGIVTGVVMMTVTGLALWFPAGVTRFLPGAVIPAAKALHTNEASILIIIVAVWHIYNAIFSPEVFPLDTVIFTGRISEERMIREHPLEYERLSGRPAVPHQEGGIPQNSLTKEVS